MKLIYTTPEAEVIIIRPTFSVLITSTGQEDPTIEDGGWGN